MSWIEKLFLHPEKLLKSLAVFLASIFVLVYAYFQIAPHVSSDVRTEVALAATVEQTTEAEGYIFRSETPVTMNGKSNIMSAVDDGEKVSKGQKIANAYQQSFDTSIQQQIEEIDRQINILSNSSVEQDFIVSDINKIDSKIEDIFKNIKTDISRNDFAGAVRQRDDLLIQMNKRQLTVNSSENYAEKISQLETQKQSLNTQLSGVATYLYAPVSGYYTNIIDGYEDKYLVSMLDKMTISDFDGVIASSENTDLKNNSAGKVITDFRWYVTCKLDKKSAADYEVGKYYTLRFPYSANKNVKMELKRVISETDKTEIVLIFSTIIMPEGFNYLRKQDVEIVNTQYTGLKVPKSAMRMISGIKGVYILVGDVISFRRAEELYEFEDSYLISMADSAYAFKDDEDADKAKNKFAKLALYDHVVVRGRDLFDGKIIS